MRRIIVNVEALLNSGCTLAKSQLPQIMGMRVNKDISINVVFKRLRDCHLVMRLDSQYCQAYAEFADGQGSEESLLFLEKLFERQNIAYSLEQRNE